MSDEKGMGDRIREAREALGLSQGRLAELVGKRGSGEPLTKSTVSKWERGDTKNLRLANLFALADVLNVSPRWLAIADGPRDPPGGVSVKAGGRTVSLAPRRLALIEAYGALPAEVRAPIRMMIETLYSARDPAYWLKHWTPSKNHKSET